MKSKKWKLHSQRDYNLIESTGYPWEDRLRSETIKFTYCTLLEPGTALWYVVYAPTSLIHLSADIVQIEQIFVVVPVLYIRHNTAILDNCERSLIESLLHPHKPL